jgi:outer membrane receptor protein involved in Fe transport
MVAAFALLLSAAAAAPDPVGSPDKVVVTATRVPEPLERVPADISVVRGDDLAARGVTDMAGALAMVPGTEAPAGGDAGPSSAVPSFWGLHEFDAFLLVVDAVPWGGAFNPAIATLDFSDLERIEVLKGPAPVMYGATSFVGVVQALHYPAGEASERADVAYGEFGSMRGSASWVLPESDRYRQSLSIDAQTQGFSDARERVRKQSVLYRGEWRLGAGKLRIDADGTWVRDVPTSPVVRLGAALSSVTPVDANFNPADSKIAEDKYHASIGYTLATTIFTWDSLASLTYSKITDIRAFLHPDLSGIADTQNQRRRIDDGYADTHVTAVSGNSTWVLGTDVLYGRGRQTSMNGNDAYTVPLDGSMLPPATQAVAVGEIGTIDDRRVFSGQFVQLDWKPNDRWDVLAGLRLNQTDERKNSSDLTVEPLQRLSESVSKTVSRASETMGVSYRWFYADYRNAFKPSTVDFGPDYSPQLLKPETARSYELGVRGTMGAGRFSYQVECFRMNFDNLAVATPSGALANAAAEELKGIEAEARWKLSPDLALSIGASYHDARYRQYLYFDGATSIDVAGRHLPLSPKVLATAGLAFAPRQGFGTTLIAKYIGRRFLDEQNVAGLSGYTDVEAHLSYAYDKYRVSLDATNLTDRRVPVSASEFGSQSFYISTGRMIWLRIGYGWRGLAGAESARLL